MSVVRSCAPLFPRTLLSLAVATTLWNAPAHAQEAAAPAADEAPAQTELAAAEPSPDAAAETEVAQLSATSASSVEEIEVLGHFQKTEIAKDLAEYGNQVQIISAAEIEAGGYTNMAELAQGMIAGAFIGYSPDEGEFTIRLDGGGDRDTLVTLDDVPLYDRGPGVEEIWGATLLDPHMIESVEVFRGGQSLYFGSNAGIGLISIRTKRPDGSRRGEMGFSYGSFNTREIWGNYSFPISDSGDHSMMIYGGRMATDGPTIFSLESQNDNHLLAGGITDFSNSRDNIGAKYLWKIDGGSQLLANVQFVQIDFQDTFPDTTIYGPTRSKMPLFNINYNKKWTERVRTDVTASYRKPELLNTKFLPEICRIQGGCPRPSGTGSVPYGQWTGRFEPQTQRGIGYNSIPAGFEELIVTALNHITFNSSIGLTAGVQSTNYRDASDPRVRIDGDIVSSNAAIADLHLTPSFSPGTNLSIAGRVENEKSFGTETIGKFGLRQALPGNTYVRVNGGNSFSLPRTNELYSNTETVVGNPDLKPEKTKTLNYGVGAKLAIGSGQLEAEVGGFSTDITDRIQATTGLTPNTRFNTTAVTEIRGIVADVNYQLGRNWDVAINYTKQDAEVEGTGKQINATPEWFATGQLRYTTDDRHYQFNLLPRYQGRTIQAPPVANLGLPDYNWGDWFVLNATAQYLTGERMEHRFQLRIENILDEEYTNRGLWGNRLYSSAAATGQLTPGNPDYYYPYPFQAKPRSFFVTYSFQF